MLTKLQYVNLGYNGVGNNLTGEHFCGCCLIGSFHSGPDGPVFLGEAVISREGGGVISASLRHIICLLVCKFCSPGGWHESFARPLQQGAPVFLSLSQPHSFAYLLSLCPLCLCLYLSGCLAVPLSPCCHVDAGEIPVKAFAKMPHLAWLSMTDNPGLAGKDNTT